MTNTTANTTAKAPAPDRATSPATTERPAIAGFVLIGIGIVLLAAQLFEPSGAIVLGALAAIFLALYAGTRQYGFLVPGMILGGLALGVGFEEAGYSLQGGVVVLGLAAGFLGIYAVSALTGRVAAWWPLIPGGILAVIGGSQAIGGTAAADVAARWWPLVLIAAGVVALIGARQQTSGRS